MPRAPIFKKLGLVAPLDNPFDRERRLVSCHILWMSLDTVRNLSQMEELLTDAMEKYKPRLLLLDEVTSVVGWQRVIKKLRDVGVLSEVCVLLTGSSSYDLKAGAERMAGRRGDISNADRVLLPMSFSNFKQQLELNQINLSEENLTQRYLEVGGFSSDGTCVRNWISCDKSRNTQKR